MSLEHNYSGWAKSHGWESAGNERVSGYRSESNGEKNYLLDSSVWGTNRCKMATKNRSTETATLEMVVHLGSFWTTNSTTLRFLQLNGQALLVLCESVRHCFSVSVETVLIQNKSKKTVLKLTLTEKHCMQQKPFHQENLKRSRH